MSGREQEHIEGELASIQRRWGIETVILVTLRDPYKNPPYLANRIMEKWDLENKKTLLLLFVKESKGWTWERRFGSAFQELSISERLDTKLGKLDGLVKRGEITVAINKCIGLISDGMTGDMKVNTKDGSFFNLEIFLHTFIGVTTCVLLFIVFRKLRNKVCFRCFRLLKVRESTPIGRGTPGSNRHIIYYCSRCGYKRIERKKEN